MKELAKAIKDTFRDISQRTQHILGGEPFTLSRDELGIV